MMKFSKQDRGRSVFGDKEVGVRGKKDLTTNVFCMFRNGEKILLKDRDIQNIEESKVGERWTLPEQVIKDVWPLGRVILV